MDRKIFKYQTKIDWEKGKQGIFQATGVQKIAVSCPPEFGGPDGFISPEDLFVGSIAVCLMATFLSLAYRAKLEFTSYSSNSEGVMEFVESKNDYAFSKVVVRPTVRISNIANKEKILELLEKAHKTCPVGLSVTCEVVLEPQVLTD